MMEEGYEVFPVHPAHEEILGVRAYPDLNSLPGPVDMVNVFRRPDALPEVVDQAIAIGAKSLWTQEGVVHPESTHRALAAGITIVVDQ
jgi:predicted CoA-binding protein